MYKGQAIVNLAEKQLGSRGSAAKAYCGLPSGANYCDAFVSWLFYKEGCRQYFCDGKKQTYCPTTIEILRKEMPMLPIYLGLPGDVILFDWEPNGNPNHIGIVRNRVSDLEIDTVEGNTSGYGTTGVVANKTRPYYIPKTKKVQIQGMFRPQFPVDKSEFDANKKLTIDGLFGFNSIACLQKALKIKGFYTGAVDAIMGLGTVKALQKAAGVDADGSWGPKTTKAVQKMIGAKVDGLFGPESTKKLQEWINKVTASTPSTGLKIVAQAKKFAWPCDTPEKKWAYKTGSCLKIYATALKKFLKYTSKKAKSDCGYFVTVCVRASGVSSTFLCLNDNDDPFPAVPSKMYIAFSGKVVPDKYLKPGDSVRYKKKNGSQHAYIVIDDNHIAEAGREIRFPVIRKLKANSKCNASGVKHNTIQILRAK